MANLKTSLTKVFIVHERSRPAWLLLVEPGLDEGTNALFRADGRQANLPFSRLDEGSMREVELETCPEVTNEQRRSYVKYWAEIDIEEDERHTVEFLMAQAGQHPIRHGAERYGGEVLLEDIYKLPELVEKLQTWLRDAISEDVIGNCGTYAGKKWASTLVPDADSGTEVSIGLHADCAALGVARFLAFIHRIGGAGQLRAKQVNGQSVLLPAEGGDQFSGSYFYWS